VFPGEAHAVPWVSAIPGVGPCATPILPRARPEHADRVGATRARAARHARPGAARRGAAGGIGTAGARWRCGVRRIPGCAGASHHPRPAIGIPRVGARRSARAMRENAAERAAGTARADVGDADGGRAVVRGAGAAREPAHTAPPPRAGRPDATRRAATCRPRARMARGPRAHGTDPIGVLRPMRAVFPGEGTRSPGSP
jgi:hypothetical protein